MTEKKKAVALQYDMDTDPAPKVVAKGQGTIADNLIEKAIEHDVEVYEDKKLVESLFGLEINEEIPEELYQAVAEIIFYIYSADERKKNSMS